MLVAVFKAPSLSLFSLINYSITIFGLGLSTFSYPRIDNSGNSCTLKLGYLFDARTSTEVVLLILLESRCKKSLHPSIPTVAMTGLLRIVPIHLWLHRHSQKTRFLILNP